MGKGDTLDTLCAQLPDLPIPPYVRLTTEQAANKKRLLELADQVGYPLIVRSDSACEDGLGRSFAGLFRSEVVHSPAELFSIASSVSSQFDAEVVSEYLGLRTDWEQSEAPERIPIILQRYVPGKARVLITKHPHEESYFMDVDFAPTDRLIRDAIGFRVDSVREMIRTIKGWSRRVGSYDTLASLVSNEYLLHEVFNSYQQIESITDSTISYQMEASISPHAVYQWRPFRIRERAAFALGDVAPEENRKTVFKVPITLGITPPEGVSLRYITLPILCRRERNLSPGFMNALSKANMYQQNGEQLAVGALNIAAATEIESFSPYYFNLALFSSIRSPSVPWQSHDTFRLFEVAQNYYGCAPFGPLAEFDECKIQYWSDGQSGIVQFFPDTQTDWGF